MFSVMFPHPYATEFFSLNDPDPTDHGKVFSWCFSELGASGTLAALAARVAPERVLNGLSKTLSDGSSVEPGESWETLLDWAVRWTEGKTDGATRDFLTAMARHPPRNSFLETDAVRRLAGGWADHRPTRDVVRAWLGGRNRRVTDEARSVVSAASSWWATPDARDECPSFLNDRRWWRDGEAERVAFAVAGWSVSPQARQVVADFVSHPAPADDGVKWSWSDRTPVVAALAWHRSDPFARRLVLNYVVPRHNAGLRFHPHNRDSIADDQLYKNLRRWGEVPEACADLLALLNGGDWPLATALMDLLFGWPEQADARRMILDYLRSRRRLRLIRTKAGSVIGFHSSYAEDNLWGAIARWGAHPDARGEFIAFLEEEPSWYDDESHFAATILRWDGEDRGDGFVARVLARVALPPDDGPADPELAELFAQGSELPNDDLEPGAVRQSQLLPSFRVLDAIRPSCADRPQIVGAVRDGLRQLRQLGFVEEYTTSRLRALARVWQNPDALAEVFAHLADPDANDYDRATVLSELLNSDCPPALAGDAVHGLLADLTRRGRDVHWNALHVLAQTLGTGVWRNIPRPEFDHLLYPPAVGRVKSRSPRSSRMAADRARSRLGLALALGSHRWSATVLEWVTSALGGGERGFSSKEVAREGVRYIWALPPDAIDAVLGLIGSDRTTIQAAEYLPQYVRLPVVAVRLVRVLTDGAWEQTHFLQYPWLRRDIAAALVEHASIDIVEQVAQIVYPLVASDAPERDLWDDVTRRICERLTAVGE